MNREILFRGKRVDNGEWIEGNYLAIYTSGLPFSLIMAKNYDEEEKRITNHAAVIPSTLGQYTGLTDRNGVKIFEGDKCVVTRVGALAYGVITFCQGCFVFKENGTGNLLHLCDVEINGYKIRVQGNIHDNPELLKGEEK